MKKMKVIDEAITAAVAAYISRETQGVSSPEECLRAQIAAFEEMLGANGYMITACSADLDLDPMSQPSRSGAA